MLKGYTGNILSVDLTQGEIRSEDLNEKIARKYIGGVGFAAKILWDETGANTEPLSPENPLIFMTGPLTGTGATPASSHYIVAGISPLTGILGEAHSGGNWADELKRAGFDGIVFRGKAPKPVYLWVHDGEAEIRDAGHLWGKDTYEVDELLKDETHEKAVVATIGPAGEKQVRLACIMNDGRAGRAAARCGLGALMGYKNLKAVVVRGTSRPQAYDPDRLRQSVKKHFDSEKIYAPEKAQERCEQGFGIVWDMGRPPIKNWLEGDFKGWREFLIKGTARGTSYYCRGCRYSCSESLMVGGERRIVGEAIRPLGSQCLIDNLEYLERAYSLCNRLGVDSISTGAVIAFAMEVFEKGLITKAQTQGIELTWGNHEAMLEMVKKICNREGFGEVLGQGVRKAAEIIGGTASEHAMHVKGLEFPAHDPRASNFRALHYATSNIGADHSSALTALEGPAITDLGIPRTDGLQSRFSTEGRGELTVKMQDYGVLYNAAVICRFVVALKGKGEKDSKALEPSHLLEWLNCATGWDMDLKEFMRVGERIINLQRLINVRRGISRKDDTLPSRFLTLRLREGGTQGNLVPLERMLPEYYLYRRWSEEGIPTKEKLVELGLGELV